LVIGYVEGKNAAAQNVAVARQPLIPIGREKAAALHLVPEVSPIRSSIFLSCVILFANASDLFAVADYHRLRQGRDHGDVAETDDVWREG
jgi:hypothetical protein